MKPLRIKALCLNIGSVESTQASSLLVHWQGKPFTAPMDAIRSFLSECHRAASSTPTENAACCKAILLAKPKAKACPDCGHDLRQVPYTPDMEDLLRNLAGMDLDEFGETVFYNNTTRDAEEATQGYDRIGKWEFFLGFPVNCDVVEVQTPEVVYRGMGLTATYSVVHVGKVATRASSQGEYTRDDL